MDNVEEMLNEYVTTYRSSCALQKEYADKVREKTNSISQPLISAYNIFMGVASSVFLLRNKNFIPDDINCGIYKARFSALIMSTWFCNEMIFQGGYLQALTLLRQQREGIAQINKLRNEKYKEGKRPHAGIFNHMPFNREIYGFLSEAAHSSANSLIHRATRIQINDIGHTSSSMPIFNESLSIHCLLIHMENIYLLLDEYLMYFMENFNIDMLIDKDRLAWNVAENLLKDNEELILEKIKGQFLDCISI